MRLRVALKVFWALGFLTVVYMFGAAFFSSDKREASPDAMSVGVSQLNVGETLKVNWEGRPILIHRRTEAEIKWLSQTQGGLADAASQHSSQPAWAKNAMRSRTPEWFVALAVEEGRPCTINADRASEIGGFIGSCDDLRFDAAGRVFAGQINETVKNLRVPIYAVDDGMILLGRHNAR